MSEERKKINIDGLLISDINIRNDFEAMDNEFVNNNNQDITKPLINCARALIENREELIKFLLPYYLCRKESKEQIKKAEIVECKDFNCENYKEGKCGLDKVRMVVIENELVCENADEPTNAGITYI